jgi:capsular exopolysaccharide synthesis family protein
VGSSRNNRVVEVSFDHTDRELAAKVVNELVSAYKEDTLSRRTGALQDLTKEMGSQSDEVQAELEKKQKQLAEFYKKNELLLAEENPQIVQRRLDDAESLLATEENELKQLEAIGALVEATAMDVEKLRGLEPVMTNTGIAYVLTEEVRAWQEYEQAKKQYQEKHPKLLEVKARAEETTRKREREIVAVAQGLLAKRDAKRKSVAAIRTAKEEMRQRQLLRDEKVIEADKLKRERDGLRTLFDTLKLRQKESMISQNITITNVHVLHEATAPPAEAPVRPNLFTNISIGLVIACFAAAAVTLLVEKIDNTIRTPEDIEIPYGLPVLAVVPERAGKEAAGPPALVCWQDELSQMAEAYRQLRAGVLLSVREVEGGNLRSILLTSAGPGEGKTSSATNLAITLAQMGNRTLLIDADFHRSETHKLFGLDRDKGLSTLLVSDIPLSQAVQKTQVPFLDFMATGMIPPQPASLLGSARMKWLLQEACRNYSRVIVDTPPLIAVTDAALLVPYVDALLMVVCQGKTMKTGLRRAMQTLTRIGVKPLGIVFNGVKSGLGDFYFKYHHPTYGGYRAEPEVATGQSGRTSM